MKDTEFFVRTREKSETIGEVPVNKVNTEPVNGFTKCTSVVSRS